MKLLSSIKRTFSIVEFYKIMETTTSHSVVIKLTIPNSSHTPLALQSRPPPPNPARAQVPAARAAPATKPARSRAAASSGFAVPRAGGGRKSRTAACPTTPRTTSCSTAWCWPRSTPAAPICFAMCALRMSRSVRDDFLRALVHVEMFAGDRQVHGLRPELL